MNIGLRPMIRPPPVGILMRGQDKRSDDNRNDDVSAGMIFEMEFGINSIEIMVFKILWYP